jgi:uncharacterized membrane protein YhaH (DUF805 family)
MGLDGPAHEEQPLQIAARKKPPACLLRLKDTRQSAYRCRADFACGGAGSRPWSSSRARRACDRHGRRVADRTLYGARRPAFDLEHDVRNDGGRRNGWVSIMIQRLRDARPEWVRVPYTIFVAILVPVYVYEYGPRNFLWFSDIALFAVLISVWTGNRLPYSMMAVGVLPLELAWTIDFITGGRLIGLTAYMFDESNPLYLRGLSLFHLFLPPLIIWLLYVRGYDRRALFAQTVLAWIVLILTKLATSSSDNINWVHGLGEDAYTPIDPVLYLSLYLILLPLVVFLPMHMLLARLFKP